MVAQPNHLLMSVEDYLTLDRYRACPTIEEYVLVDTQQQAVEVYRREQDTFWKLYRC